jgi:lipoic acid synthetase
MKESAQAALSYVRSQTDTLGIKKDFYEKTDIHIHVPAGAIPKDGPSAGVTMTTAIVSLLTGKVAKHDVAMTGEITLRGKVMPIGGVKEKVLAARRAGIKTVILPEKNKNDLDDVPEDLRKEMKFIFVDTIDQVIDAALDRRKVNNAGKRKSKEAPAVVSDKAHHERTLYKIKTNNLNTVCRSAACPNQAECWDAGTAAFMILGNICTRSCRFCNVLKGTPEVLDLDEPNRVALAVAALRLNYAVVTSVTRDDLEDGGAELFAATIRAIRAKTPGCRVEILVPDFQGSDGSLRAVLDADPDVLNHNLETVPSLYSRVRPQADYQRSLGLLSRSKSYGAVTKTGLMLGLGEELDEVRLVMNDLLKIGCNILTIGQYLQPNKGALPVEKYYHPDEFSKLREEALAMGFRHVEAGPLVRSSYHAGKYGG